MVDYDKMLAAIPPDCSYEEWMKVGMALKKEGRPLSDWDSWSAGGSKYKRGECARKWESFRRDEVTGGTLAYIAASYGYEPDKGEAMDISNLLLDPVIDPSFVGEEKIPPVPQGYDPRLEMLEYFTTLFKPEDFVGYCTSFRNGRPAGTVYRRTAGDIVERLKKGSIEDALGSLDPQAGAYVRFNPLDGAGEGNANVTRWTHCLVESDTQGIEKQYALLKEMNLPITFVIHSGGRSLHALVRVDAVNAQQYRHRTQELYEFCHKNGLDADEADKNESRFSRLPGVRRGQNWQRIVARGIGAKSYDDWIRWREEQADDLPETETLADVWGKWPELAPELIEGVLRQGHKLLLSGPSKAGKSFLLILLAICITEGIDWLGHKVRQGKVCYVNLELDRASCLGRFREIYEKLGVTPKHPENLTIWNLRGRAVPMDKLAPVLAHRFADKHFSGVIIDPIYKVITGDENSATDMAKFCSYFDRVAADMGASVIYCHHHSKGAGGKYSNTADRSSGSGVFARDPDAICDLSGVDVKPHVGRYRSLHPDACEVLSGWELSMTLREFPAPPAKRIWFDYPLHKLDEDNILAVAAYSSSQAVGRGVTGKQVPKAEWLKTARGLLDVVQGDTAVTLEQIGEGLTADNAKKVFGADTAYELATLDGVKVVHERDKDEIVFRGCRYKRNGKRWGEA